MQFALAVSRHTPWTFGCWDATPTDAKHLFDKPCDGASLVLCWNIFVVVLFIHCDKLKDQESVSFFFLCLHMLKLNTSRDVLGNYRWGNSKVRVTSGGNGKKKWLNSTRSMFPPVSSYHIVNIVIALAFLTYFPSASFNWKECASCISNIMHL